MTAEEIRVILAEVAATCETDVPIDEDPLDPSSTV